jgi:hypothetical protein
MKGKRREAFGGECCIPVMPQCNAEPSLIQMSGLHERHGKWNITIPVDSQNTKLEAEDFESRACKVDGYYRHSLLRQ